jgi:hypothetical protein
MRFLGAEFERWSGRTMAVTNAHRESSDVLFPDAYVWFVLLSALDVLITHTVLFHFEHLGGSEANPVANLLINKFGFNGAIVLKFAIVILVIGITEFVGRKDNRSARHLVMAVLGLACVPVVVGLSLLARAGAM